MNITNTFVCKLQKIYFPGSSWDIPFIRVSLAGDDFPAFSGDFGDIPAVGEKDTSREDTIEPLPEVLNIKSVKNRELLNLLNRLQEKSYDIITCDINNRA